MKALTSSREQEGSTGLDIPGVLSSGLKESDGETRVDRPTLPMTVG